MSRKKILRTLSAFLAAAVMSANLCGTVSVFADENDNWEKLYGTESVGGDEVQGDDSEDELTAVYNDSETDDDEFPEEESDDEKLEEVDELEDDDDGVQFPAESIKLKTKKEITIEEGRSFRISAVLVPDYSDDIITYKTTNKQVLTVTQDGAVTAVGQGTASVTLRTTSGAKATIKVKVTKNTSLPLSFYKMTLRKGKKATLTYSLNDENINDEVTFHSSDTSVAKVSAGGKVTAVDDGTAVITVKTSSGLSSQCSVTVYSGTFRGIDVSRWQKTINWKKVSVSGVDFAMIRATYGDEDVDEKLAKNVAGCEKYGIPYGFYHYTYAKSVSEAKKEAKFFLKTIKKYSPEYPIVLDIEEAMYKKMTRKEVTKIITTFMTVFEDAGYYAMIYSYADFFTKYTNIKSLRDYDIWVACWGDKEKLEESYSYHYGMWQYSSKGKINGINNEVDLDYAYKNYPSRIRKAGLNNLE